MSLLSLSTQNHAMDTVAAEKAAAICRYSRLQKLSMLIRCLEIAVVILVLSWSSIRLPAVARISGELLCRVVTHLLSPRCVFVIGNAIVILLLYNSGHLSTSSSSSSSSPSSAGKSTTTIFCAHDLYEEFLETRGGRLSYSLPRSQPSAAEEEEKKEVVYQDKAVFVETRRAYRRSRSERKERRRRASPVPELRRAASDVGKKGSKKTAKTLEEAEAEEDVDPEEFRRTIEAFIAKQTKFHQEESIAVVSAEGARYFICSAASTDQCILEQEQIVKENKD